MRSALGGDLQTCTSCEHPAAALGQTPHAAVEPLATGSPRIGVATDSARSAALVQLHDDDARPLRSGSVSGHGLAALGPQSVAE